jgi:hypothetical protein
MPSKIDGTNGVLQAYDYQTPTTGFSYTFAAGTQTLFMVPAATLATGTITMPASPADGMMITFSSSQQITALTLQGNTGQSISSAVTTLPAQTAASYVYRLSNTTWYPYQTVPSNLYPTSYSLASATGAAVSRTVYLTAGTWQVVLDTRAGISDSGTYTFNTTQSGSIGATTVNTSIGFSRTGGSGYGRTIHGSQLAVGTLTVVTGANYTLAMAAVSLNGAFTEGSRIIVEKTA